MELLKDITLIRDKIEASINKYGYGVEHNFYNLKYLNGSSALSAFFLYGHDQGVMCLQSQGIWELLPGILAREEEKFNILTHFIDYIFQNEGANEIYLILPKHIHAELIKLQRYTVNEIIETFYLPIFDLKGWDPNLPGKGWKDMRNTWNKFHRHHSVSFVPVSQIPAEQLQAIVAAWMRKRSSPAHLWQPQFYQNVIDGSFEGIMNTYSLVVDGIPSTICGGWMIPHSNDYYSLLGLTNYQFDNVGEIAILYEMNLLKQKGYDAVNFGQSDELLLNYKKKFKPCSIDTECLFTVAKNK